MDLTRRQALRGAAAVGGAAALSPVLGSLSNAAVAASGAAGTTLATRIVRGTPNAKGYAKLTTTAGEGHLLRTDLGGTAGPNRASTRTPLLAFAQFSDVHVVDHQSPGRVEYLDRFEDPNPADLKLNLLDSSYRPHEILSAQVAESMVRAINDIGVGPITNQDLAFVIETGDNSDNSQKNEIRWNIDILDGKNGVRPDSGSYSRYEGVSDNNALYYDTHYWHPEGTPFLKVDDKYRDRYGFPVVKGLLNAARQPFNAVGLRRDSNARIPWYSVFGNHDGLIQGNFPASTTQLGVLCTGGIKVITVPPGLSQSDVINALYEGDIEELITSLVLLPGVRLVTPDPNRKALSRKQVVEEHFNTTGLPVGHGFTNQNRTDGTAYYYFEDANIRHIVMDTVNPNGYADGSLDKPQFKWLQATVESTPAGKYVIVYSHHTSDTMQNTLVLTGGDLSLPRASGKTFVNPYLLSQPKVIAWVNGHTHDNRITPHVRADGSGGFWEINTASHIDFPQQARLIEILDNQDGTLSIFTTIVDHVGDIDYGGDLSNPVALAGLSRELAANDPQSNLAKHTGSPDARNTELLLPKPA